MNALQYDDIFGLTDLSTPVIIRSKADIDQSPFAYSHMMRKAWDLLDLDAVVCVNSKPTVYFKQIKDYDENAVRSIHKTFWNQGLATILVIMCGPKIYIYSGLTYPASSTEELNTESRLAVMLDSVADAVKLKDFISSVESGKFYKENSKAFCPDKNIDTTLLKNLSIARDELLACDDQVGYKKIHNLLCRLIFVFYLTDREIIGKDQFQAAGANGVSTLRQLLECYPYNECINILNLLFLHLKSYFNGTMFDVSLSDAVDFITTSHLQVIHRFLKGDSLETGQQALGFWAYDFSIIPIESISAIYEDFLQSESEYEKHNDGAYYTPKLLAEMVIDVATSSLDSLIDKTFFDPACGSGVFLVTIFNRIAEEWKYKNREADNVELANALFHILHKHIRGLDINVTACRITCFSLYLALLDHLEPRDIDEIKRIRGVVFSNLLWTPETSDTQSSGNVILHGNFFDTSLPLPSDVDVIIGNPPWGGRNNEQEDTILTKWCEDNVFRKESSKKLTLEHFLPQKQIAHSFLWKSLLHTKEEGKICLLVTSKVLFNKTHKFQLEWFSRCNIEEIYQLSDVRFMLFDKAINPALVIKFSNSVHAESDNIIKYFTPKATAYDPRRGVVSVLPSEEKCISACEVIEAAQANESAIFWKKHFWGTPRDVRLIDKLLRLPTLKELISTKKSKKMKRWFGTQGFQPFNQESYDSDPEYGEHQDPYWEPCDLYLDAKKVPSDILLEKTDCSAIGNQFPKLHRRREEFIYTPPMVIANKGFTKVVFCNFKVYFQDALYSIAGPSSDTQLLIFLAAYLKSDLAKYYIFHTSSSWGIERPQIHPNEYKKLPFFLPEQSRNKDRCKSILNSIEEMYIQLQKNVNDNFLYKENEIDRFMYDSNEMVYQYFDLNQHEICVIKDTINHHINAITPSNFDSIYNPGSVTFAEKEKYANRLCDTLNKWSKKGQFSVSAKTYTSSCGIALLCLTKTIEAVKYHELPPQEDFFTTIASLIKSFSFKRGFLVHSYGLKVFDGRHIYILKDLSKSQWLESVALNDADEIATEILQIGE